LEASEVVETVETVAEDSAPVSVETAVEDLEPEAEEDLEPEAEEDLEPEAAVDLVVETAEDSEVEPEAVSCLLPF
jgi:hypothetical protein